ncbi:unnamed protein product [Sphagnum balticum]
MTVTEKRWIKFKGNPDPTTVPVEWNSWLNGRRERAPTPEEMIELEAHRKAVKVKVALLEKEEEKNRFRAKVLQQGMSNGQNTVEKTLLVVLRDCKVAFTKESLIDVVGRLSEPKGKGDTFKPGTWQPPS